jgi:hypothetical protein
VDRLPVRYAALACVISGGMLIGGPGLVASADDGTGGSTGTAGDSQSSDTSSTPHSFLSSLASLPGLLGLSQLSAANVPSIGAVAPPVMSLPPQQAPTTAPNGPKLVQAFMLPDSGNPHRVAVTVPESAPQTPDRERPGNSPGAGPQSVPQPQTHQQPQQGENTSPTLLPLAPSDAPAGITITIPNPLPGGQPIDLNKPLLPQVLPPPLVMLLTAIAKQIPLANLVITPLLNMTLLSNTAAPTLPPGGLLPATMPSALSNVNRALLAPSGPPPADVAPMGMDVPDAPAQEPTSPPDGTAGPLTGPRNGVSSLSEPVAFRAGYSDYLRNAGMAQITAIAVPGAVAILLFSLGGGFIGYRQARAGHIIRAEGIARFLR